MKQIIGKHLNTKPVGIRNSASEPDLDVLASGAQVDTSGEDTGPVALSENDEDETQGHCTQIKRSVSAAGLDEDVKPRLGTSA